MPQLILMPSLLCAEKCLLDRLERQKRVSAELRDSFILHSSGSCPCSANLHTLTASMIQICWPALYFTDMSSLYTGHWQVLIPGVGWRHPLQIPFFAGRPPAAAAALRMVSTRVLRPELQVFLSADWQSASSDEEALASSRSGVCVSACFSAPLGAVERPRAIL